MMIAPSSRLLRALQKSISPRSNPHRPWQFSCRRLHLEAPSRVRRCGLQASSDLLPWTRRYSMPSGSRDRGPESSESTQTNFGMMDMLGNSPPPTTAIDACLPDGFHLDNGIKIDGGSGCILLAGEAFSWDPWQAGTTSTGKGEMLNSKGQWAVDDEAWGLLDLVWPKPGMLQHRTDIHADHSHQICSSLASEPPSIRSRLLRRTSSTQWESGLIYSIRGMLLLSSTFWPRNEA